jgi:opacity protein-like surface antigen
MTSFPDLSRFARRSLAAALFASATATAISTCASAADMPETILRGGTYSEPSPDYMRWDGVSLGATFGWTNITVDYSSAFAAGTTTKDQTNSAQFGGFLGYNWQWETLVLGVEGAYNRPASLDSSGTDAGQSATYKLIDYGTVRARAGYAYGHFLPYAFLGAAVGRINYVTPTTSKNNAFAPGFEAGLGVDVALMPNVFLRAEYEYVLFGPIGDIRSGISTARAGVGIRF